MEPLKKEKPEDETAKTRPAPVSFSEYKRRLGATPMAGTWRDQGSSDDYQRGALEALEEQLRAAKTPRRRAIIQGRIDRWHSGARDNDEIVTVRELKGGIAQAHIIRRKDLRNIERVVGARENGPVEGRNDPEPGAVETDK